MEKVNTKKKFDVTLAILILVIIAFGAMTVTCYISQYEKNYRLKVLKNELAIAQNEGELLRIEYEKRTNYRNVEDYVVNNLGMTKINSYQIEYIVSTNTNQTLLISAEEDDAGLFSRISRAFSVAMEYFK